MFLFIEGIQDVISQQVLVMTITIRYDHNESEPISNEYNLTKALLFMSSLSHMMHTADETGPECSLSALAWRRGAPCCSGN